MEQNKIFIDTRLGPYTYRIVLWNNDVAKRSRLERFLHNCFGMQCKTNLHSYSALITTIMSKNKYGFSVAYQMFILEAISQIAEELQFEVEIK